MFLYFHPNKQKIYLYCVLVYFSGVAVSCANEICVIKIVAITILKLYLNNIYLKL